MQTLTIAKDQNVPDTFIAEAKSYGYEIDDQRTPPMPERMSRADIYTEGPKVGDKYYFLLTDGIVGCNTWDNDTIDEGDFKYNILYRTHEACAKYERPFQEALTFLRRTCLDLGGVFGAKPNDGMDWWTVVNTILANTNGRWTADFYNIFLSAGIFWFKNESICNRFLETPRVKEMLNQFYNIKGEN